MSSNNSRLFRCPSPTPHGKYQTCGHTLGGISDNRLYYYCSQCNKMWEVEMLDGGVVFKKMNKNDRLDANELLMLIEE